MLEPVNFETMSDEDFLNAAVPVEGTPVVEATPIEEDHTTPKHTEATEEAEVVKVDEPAEEVGEADDDDAFSGDAPKATEEAAVEETPEEAEVETEAKETEPAPAAINFEDEYNKLMAPFKANGREFKVETPDEAVRLMQMGANYTKKMQALAPNLKLMKMLDNNDLLTEDKITFLIDLNENNPAAIQKLLHDSKIDPLDIDVTQTPAYQKGNHSITDQEMSFHDILADVRESPTGSETINLIDKQWDDASKAAVYNDPIVLKIIDQQRSNGLYAQITAELDRQKTLGNIPAHIPFIEAYKQVGDKLHQEGKFGPAPANAVTGNAPDVIETRAATRKPAVTNGDKAKAASSVKSSAKVVPKTFDPISMSDSEIMALTSLTG